MRRHGWLVVGVAMILAATEMPALAQRGGGMGGGMCRGGGMGSGMMGGSMRGGMGGGMMGGGMMGGRGMGMQGPGMGGGMSGGCMGGSSGMSGGSTNGMETIARMQQNQMQMQRAQIMASIAAMQRRRAIDSQLVAARRTRMAENAGEIEVAAGPASSREIAAARMWGRREAWKASLAARRGNRGLSTGR